MSIRYISCPHCKGQIILIGKDIVAQVYEYPEDDTNGHFEGEL